MTNFKLEFNAENKSVEKKIHRLFKVYFSNNLIILIEINIRIKKHDFGLFYYNQYKNEIQDCRINNKIIIIKYKNKKKEEQRYFQYCISIKKIMN